jgi:hypothetical protein
MNKVKKEPQEDKRLKEFLLERDPDFLRFLRGFLITSDMLLESIQLKYKYEPPCLQSYSLTREHCGRNFAGSGFDKLIKLMEKFSLQEICTHFPATTGHYNGIKQYAIMNYIKEKIISPCIDDDYRRPGWYESVRKIVICSGYKDQAKEGKHDSD